eukprot:Platyproteum_vivax@DN10850_c0_g1_i1.p1
MNGSSSDFVSESSRNLSSATLDDDGSRDVRVKLPPRQGREVLFLVRAWNIRVHPRAKSLWHSQEMLNNLLAEVIKCISKRDDPVLGADDCVDWMGEMMGDDQLPAIQIVKPGDMEEKLTYVTRILAFLFADDESFLVLQQKPKKGFETICGNKRCINIHHIAVD